MSKPSRQRQPIPNIEAICIECGKLASLTNGVSIYPQRPDLWDRPYWVCECGAYVGSHMGTEIPLGYPAGPATRAARGRAHAAFDPLWKAKVAQGTSKGRARGLGYAWLAEQLGLSPTDTHISMFDAATADRVVEVIAKWRTTRATSS